MNEYKQNKRYYTRRGNTVYLGNEDVKNVPFSHEELSAATSLQELDRSFAIARNAAKHNCMSMDDLLSHESFPVYSQWLEREISQADPAVVVKYIMWLIGALQDADTQPQVF